ncbi:MAG: hypothetical protein KAH44_07205, partial [Oricola sp.]|nr:hypothetical protein [Oricola sp.]
ASLLTSEVDKGTTSFAGNFDGTLAEPIYLPAQVPLLLMNGAAGIAVGMPTDIPPHNMTEVIEAACLVIKKGTWAKDHESGRQTLTSTASLDDVMQILPAPDYPTGAGIISTPAEIRDAYETGQGKIRARCKWDVEDKDTIVISQVPHKASPAKIIAQIAALMNEKKLNGVDDVMDESDQDEPVRIAVKFRPRTTSAERVMALLCKNTDCEKSYKVNMHAISTIGEPKLYSLMEYLTEWSSWRLATTQRRLNHRLRNVEERLHILQALIDIYVHIDDVIRIIRNADDPKTDLMHAFNIDQAQADAVLSIRLRALAKLEFIKLETERAALSDEREGLQAMLSSEEN